jgi:hypothetical protein
MRRTATISRRRAHRPGGLILSAALSLAAFGSASAALLWRRP